MTFNFDSVSDILACPRCRGALICVGESLVCDSEDHRLQFPIKDGIPRLLVEEASELSDDAWDQLRNRQEQSP